MPADTSVKVFHSGLSGAPVLSGTAGALIGVLDACLVNGWGLGTVDSITIAGGVGTVTRGAGHPFEVGSVALIADATVAGGSINGEHRVLSATVTAWTFDATGLANQAAGGTPTHKVAPAGWSNTDVAAAGNVKAYRSLDVTGTQMYLRVDDSGAQEARVVGYETMSDVNTGTGPFPTAAQQSGGLHATKSSTADATARSWTLIGDGKTFYFMPAYHSSYPVGPAFSFSFGDISSVRSPDAYACHINGTYSAETTTVPGSSNYGFDLSTRNAPTGCYLARSYSGLGGAVNAGRGYATICAVNASSVRSGTNSTGHAPYPNAADGGLYVSPWSFFEPSGGDVFRGFSRGSYAVPQYVQGGTFGNRDRVAGLDALAGRELLIGVSANSSVVGFDVTGPWA